MAKIASCAEFLKRQRAGTPSPRRTGAGVHAAPQSVPGPGPRPRPVLDDAGGRGTVTQWIGPPGSRKVDAAMALLLAAAEDGLGCAWVEARVGSPCPAQPAPLGWSWHRTGVYAAYSLIARTGSSAEDLLPCSRATRGLESGQRLPRSDPRRRCMAAVQATVQLLGQRRWAVVVLHLGGVPPAALRQIGRSPLAFLRDAAGRSGTALVLLVEGRALDLSGGVPGPAVSVLRFEPRALRSAHGLRRWPEITQGKCGIGALRWGQGTEGSGRLPKTPSQWAAASTQAVAFGALRPTHLGVSGPFLVR